MIFERQKKALVTGSLGLVGRSTAERLLKEGYKVYGVDNNYRSVFFNMHERPEEIRHRNYKHLDMDIRGTRIVKELNFNFDVIVHCAAQPSHDLADKKPYLDFDINVRGTENLLELFRINSPKATFIYLSTTKVYPDTMNEFVEEEESRYTVNYLIDERTQVFGHHGMFGVHKLMSDLLVQEYGRHYNLMTIVLRPGCITGKAHRGTREHGFLSYLAKCFKENTEYIINGYKGKQVRDQIHVEDLTDAIMEIIKRPERNVYVIGGGLENSISIQEAIEKLKYKFGKDLNYRFEEAREADHKWNVHDNSKLMKNYPDWKITRDLDYILNDLI